MDRTLLVNASVGLQLGSTRGLRDAVLQLNGTNLGNKRYISTVGSNGFVNSDKTGAEQTLLAGAPRALFMSFSGKF